MFCGWRNEMDNKSNPFGITIPIQKPEFFFGRKNLIDTINDLLINSTPCSVVGPRRIGKSSLLYQYYNLSAIQDQIISSISVYFFDSSKDRDPRSFLNTMKKTLSVNENFSSLTTSPHLDDLYDENEELINGLNDNGKTPLILLDEIENLTHHKFHDILNWLRALVSNGKLNIITSSKKSLRDLLRNTDDVVSGFWNIFRQVNIGLMTPTEVHELIEGVATPEFNNAFGNRIIEEAGCHPFFIHQLGQLVFKEWKKKEKLIDSQWNDIILEFNNSVSHHYDYLINSLSPSVKKFLTNSDLESDFLFNKTNESFRTELNASCILDSQNRLFSKSFKNYLFSLAIPFDFDAAKDSFSIPLDNLTRISVKIIKYLAREKIASESQIAVELRLLPDVIQNELNSLYELKVINIILKEHGTKEICLTDKGKTLKIDN
jgi:hypothetical protein